MDWKRAISIVKVAAVNVLFAASCLFLLWLFCLVFVYASFTIPTDSMQPGIKPGDTVVVEKVSTGARLFDIVGAAYGDSVNVWRMPGWRKFRRGDVLVFNFVHTGSWDTIAMNIRKYYIKRCVAGPGDTLAIRNFAYVVNGDTLEGYPPASVYEMFYPDDATGRAERRRGYMADLSDTIDNWTIRDYGPIAVPARGVTLPIDTVTFRRYRQIMEFETGQSVERRDGKVWLGGKPLTDYTFKENYYFMAGDNSVASMDSRYWGLVPEDFIVGRAVLKVWSSDRSGIQWNRILTPVK
ncbi:MAG: signal peptidase I [Bacteroides sp.]|nr:signal peptidase I [Bacteroides sp.]